MPLTIISEQFDTNGFSFALEFVPHDGRVAEMLKKVVASLGAPGLAVEWDDASQSVKLLASGSAKPSPKPAKPATPKP